LVVNLWHFLGATTGQILYHLPMPIAAPTEVRPDLEQDAQTDSSADLEPGYLVVCWDDPVNLMQYVTHVFQTVFGWERKKAEKHMLEVHEQGRSVLKRESLEKAEFYVHQLQKYTLQATMERDSK
jgi:ATP-dependent Clp protease adaptor protein ClpS